MVHAVKTLVVMRPGSVVLQAWTGIGMDEAGDNEVEVDTAFSYDTEKDRGRGRGIKSRDLEVIKASTTV